MFKKIKAWWAKSQRKSELRLLRKHYLRKTGVNIDHYSDEEVEKLIKIGNILKKHEISVDDAIKYLGTIVAMDKERGKQ